MRAEVVLRRIGGAHVKRPDHVQATAGVCGESGGCGVSGLYVLVWLAGPCAAHWLHSDEISGWLRCERRIEGPGAVPDVDVMLMDEIRCLRRTGDAGRDA